ncbi:hypothetical protein RF11_06931 [Thelohanellus kitauei]|uniref:Uncharacterized protein n=1 Tax=Thelohanellus kitauei TaxID=669202 RepID=A0A0C2JGT7_THEKT|nr:hypothetical protein RF11_06931 [Thelohanellus kitauei]
MNKSVFQTLYIVINVVALVFSAILIVALMAPTMFVIMIKDDNQSSVAYFGPFNWHHDGKLKTYESVTGGFRFIQLMFVLATGASFFSSVFAVVGYLRKRFRRPAAISLLTTVPIQGILALSYTIQYIWTYFSKTFISLQRSILDIKIGPDSFPVPRLMYIVWAMTLVYFVLAIMVFVHKFTDERIDFDEK